MWKGGIRWGKFEAEKKRDGKTCPSSIGFEPPFETPDATLSISVPSFPLGLVLLREPESRGWNMLCPPCYRLLRHRYVALGLGDPATPRPGLQPLKACWGPERSGGCILSSPRETERFGPPPSTKWMEEKPQKVVAVGRGDAGFLVALFWWGICLSVSSSPLAALRNLTGSVGYSGGNA